MEVRNLDAVSWTHALLEILLTVFYKQIGQMPPELMWTDQRVWIFNKAGSTYQPHRLCHLSSFLIIKDLTKCLFQWEPESDILYSYVLFLDTAFYPLDRLDLLTSASKRFIQTSQMTLTLWLCYDLTLFITNLDLDWLEKCGFEVLHRPACSPDSCFNSSQQKWPKTSLLVKLKPQKMNPNFMVKSVNTV